MNRDDIIRIAKEAGYTGYDSQSERIHKFATLIEDHLRWDGIHTCHDQCQRPACVAVREAVRAEREACAQLCESYVAAGIGREMAAAIRARGGE